MDSIKTSFSNDTSFRGMSFASSVSITIGHVWSNIERSDQGIPCGMKESPDLGFFRAKYNESKYIGLEISNPSDDTVINRQSDTVSLATEDIKKNILGLSWMVLIKHDCKLLGRKDFFFCREDDGMRYNNFLVLYKKGEQLMSAWDVDASQGYAEEWMSYLESLFNFNKESGDSFVSYVIGSKMIVLLREILVKVLNVTSGSIQGNLAIDITRFFINSFPHIFNVDEGLWLHRAIVCDSYRTGNKTVGALVHLMIDNDMFNMSLKDTMGNEPLHYAVFLGNEPLASLFLRLIDDCRAHDDSEVVRGNDCFLGSKSFLINHKNYSGDTPLHYAVMSGSTDCLRLLLEKGARYYQPNLNNETVLDFAYRLGSQEIIHLLENIEAQEQKIKQSFIINNTELTPSDILEIEKMIADCVF